MKQFVLLLTAALPVLAFGQKVPDFKKADKEFCKETINLYGFDNVTTEPCDLAGKEDGYPALTRTIVIDATTNARDTSGWRTYQEKIKPLCAKIGKEYGDVLLLTHPDQQEVRVLFEINYNKNGYRAGNYFSLSTYNPKRGY